MSDNEQKKENKLPSTVGAMFECRAYSARVEDILGASGKPKEQPKKDK